MISVSFTEQEINVLNQLIDIAIKATGLQGAEAGVVLSKKLNDAARLAAVPAENKEAA